MMKKVALMILMFVMPLLALPQSALDKFEDKDDVTSMEVTKRMFELMAQVGGGTSDAETQQYMALLHKLDNLKMFSTSSSKVTSEMRKAFGKYVKKEKMDELVSVSEGGQSMKMAIKPTSDGRSIKELLMFAEGDSVWNPTLLMLIKGNFTLDDISAFTDKLPFLDSEGIKGGVNQKL